MASKALKNPLIRNVAVRGYAQAAPAIKDAKVASCVLPNSVSVHALDNGSPVTRVTVAFKAGSRYEPSTDLGIAHVLRSAAGLSTKTRSGFLISRQLSQIGASVSASGDREFMYYTLETTKDNVQAALEYLNHIVSNQEFRPWELSDNVPRLKYELASLSPQIRAIDLLHRAVYRRGLGNSLFVAPKRVDKISSESLQHFASNYLGTSRCAVTVVGDSLDTASLVGTGLQVAAGVQVNNEPSCYFGGELRKEMGGELAHVALALQGAPAGTPQALALAIAARALGSGPVTKWGADNSALAGAIGNIGPFAAAGFSTSYSDTGLVGAILSVPKDEAAKAVCAVAKFLKCPKLSSAAIASGKNLLKLQVLSEAEEGSSLAESMAAQALYTGKVRSPTDIAADIDRISEQDVVSALNCAAGSKLSMGAAGNLAFVPYADEI